MNKKVIGYVGIERLSLLKKEDIEVLSGINLAFGLVKEGDVVCDLQAAVIQFARIREINPRIAIILSIGGWGAGGFSEAAADAEGRHKFATSAIRLVETYDLDGLDVDWEYPCIGIGGIACSMKDKDNFTLLIKELREQLDQLPGKHILSIAGGGDSYYTRCTDLKQAEQYLDYIQIMTYDLRGGFLMETGHHTNLYSNQADLVDVSADRAVEHYLEAGVPREKIIIGVAFYSRVWKGVPNVNNGWMQMAMTTGQYGPFYDELKQSYINKNGFIRYWDEEAKAPYLFNGDTFISYDDEESIWFKGDYVREQGLGGLMFWEYINDSNQLTQAIAKSL